jgi:hypothetical protein
MFGLDWAFQPSPTFVSKAGAYPSLLSLPTNIRPGWRGFPGTNTLAYRAVVSPTKKKGLYNIDTSLGLHFKTFYGNSQFCTIIS